MRRLGTLHVQRLFFLRQRRCILCPRLWPVPAPICLSRVYTGVHYIAGSQSGWVGWAGSPDSVQRGWLRQVGVYFPRGWQRGVGPECNHWSVDTLYNVHCLLPAGWWPPQLAHLRTTDLPALISLKHCGQKRVFHRKMRIWGLRFTLEFLVSVFLALGSPFWFSV